MFDSMIDSLTSKITYAEISKQDYDDFERCWIMYILQDKRYGQAFIEHFELSKTTPLYYFKDTEISRRWIMDNYL